MTPSRTPMVMTVDKYLPCVWNGEQTKNEEHKAVVLSQNKNKYFSEKKFQLRGKRAAEGHEEVFYSTIRLGCWWWLFGGDVVVLIT